MATAIVYKKISLKRKHSELRLNLYRFPFNAIVHLVERIPFEHWTVRTQAADSLSLLRRFASCAKNVVAKVGFLVCGAAWA